MLRTVLAAATLLSLGAWCPQARAEEIPYVETFALAADRQAVLDQLIPGTEDYFYYHCLNNQHLQQFEKIEPMLQSWIERHGQTARVREIMHRQALLTFEQNPQKSLDYLRRVLNLNFDHQREVTDRPPDLPAALDAKLIARDTLTQRAMREQPNLQGFEDDAFDWLVAAQLNKDQRRELLSRLQRADYPGLVDVLLADLNSGVNFGSYGVHSQLLLTQMDELAQRKPDLLSNSPFVLAYLSKLRPAAGVDWTVDATAREAYLDRLWIFVQKLPAAFNSLKANVLYHRLVHDRGQGLHDRERFMNYVRLPRGVPYANPEFVRRFANSGGMVDLNAGFDQQTSLSPIVSDEPLVRAYLLHFFVEDTTYQPFVEFIREEYLRAVFAETKIVNGLGELEQWVTWISPAEFQALKERVDLEFAPTNKVVMEVDSPVRLDMAIKNASTLIVKVFEINTTNFYRQNQREIDTDINLDGLTPNWEYSYTYDDPPLRKINRHFEFPELSRRGVYVVDFIGNGKSSRALIRKGRLRYVTRQSTVGQVFQVLDESNRPLPDAQLLLANQEFTANQQGEITLPYSNAPAEQPIVLIHNGFATLERIYHLGENHRLSAGVYVDREALLRSRKATLIVRPGLTVNGTPVTLSVLENTRLRITSTDLDGIASTQEIANFALHEDRDSTHEIQVPPRLARLDVALLAQVKSLTQNKTLDLETSDAFELNGIDRTAATEDAHLTRADGGYWLEILGKTGEPEVDRPIMVSLKHREFRQPVQVALKTDAAGRIQLGKLTGIDSVQANLPQGTSQSWTLTSDRQTYAGSVHGVEGRPIDVPYPGSEEPQPTREAFSLLELRDGTFVADHFEALSLLNGNVRISGLAAGDYDLWLKRRGVSLRIRIAAGDVWNNHVLGDSVLLEVRQPDPVSITSTTTDDEALRVQLKNATPFTRIHVLGSRYLPQYDEFARLAAVRDSAPQWAIIPAAKSAFLEGRNIGDEYRYIIDRKYATKYPGNMLNRPELLLNPWPVRDTQTSLQQAAQGDDFAAMDPAAAAPRPQAMEGQDGRAVVSGSSNLDFLLHSSAVLVNLRPDEQGQVVIPRDLLANFGYVRIVVADPVSVASRLVTLPDQPLESLDLRLAKSLDVDRHYTQQKRVTLVRQGETFTVADLASSRFEAYDSLAKIHALFRTLSNNADLIEFQFLLDWTTYTPEKKEELYAKYACHELDHFLFRRDAEFFERVVRPHLRYKREKQFLDHWLLGDDVSGYAVPWRYEQLTTVERILLAQRLDGLPVVAQEISDRLELIPLDVTRLAVLFDTATGVSRLDSESLVELAKSKSSLESLARRSGAARGAVAAGGGMGGMAGAAAPASPPAEAAARKLVEADEKKRERFADKFAETARDRAENLNFFGVPAREELKQLFQPVDKTREWAENQFYHVPLDQQTTALVGPNPFWLEYARTKLDQPLVSTSFPQASSTFTEMMFVLAVIDLPARSPKHEYQFEDGRMTLTAGGQLLAFHEEIQETPLAGEVASILVSQNFFRQSDRYQMVAGQRVDKFVTDEFLVNTVYGCQIVVTNPTSSAQRFDVLLQVPAGAMPLALARYTRSVSLQLDPFSTQTIDYLFYFPDAGEYTHYPVHVGRDDKVLAAASPVPFKVVEKLSGVDKDSWDYVSQQGSEEEVLSYLKDRNLFAVNLERIAWRMRDGDFFQQAIQSLAARRIYNHVLWSYSVLHNQPAAIREFLQHAAPFNTECGPYLDSPLLTLDPVARRSFEHLEYKPLINARAHQLGERRQILNDRFFQHYHRLLQILACRRELDDNDLLGVTYFMLLQDRVEEARQYFIRIRPDRIQTRIQYDYCDAYLDFYNPDPVRARQIAAQYVNYPVDRWRSAFGNIREQLAEIEGGRSGVVDPLDRNQTQGQLAAQAPSFDLKLQDQKVVLTYQNLPEVQVNFYEMDIELLFSRNPFVQQFSGQFSYIRPNVSKVVTLAADQTQLVLELPEDLRARNVLVEAVGAGITRSEAYYSNSLTVQLSENYGQLRVLDASSSQPLPKVYVKVYARMQDGQVQFFKDGYTDLRGRFDYASLSTNQLDAVQRLSLLILSDDQGAVVREVAPPAR